MRVLGIDPGTAKCGYAVLDPDGALLALGIVPIAGLDAAIAGLVEQFAPGIAAVGRGTNAAAVGGAAQRHGLRVALVDEHETTLRARARFFRDHPPRGWRRLIPRGMLLPDRPIDDYAAVLIAERFLRNPE